MAKLADDLDLRKVEIFYWVAELGSFSLAARHLYLRQPTISAHIRELEERLGGEILNRVGRDVTLTALGQVLFERARELVGFKRRTIAALDGFRGVVQGELRVGGSNIPGEYILPRRIGAFVKKYPRVKPILRIGDSAEIVQALLEGEIEIGYIGFKVRDRRLALRKIWKDEMVAAVPGRHPWAKKKAIGLKEVAQEGFVSREGGSGTLRSLSRLLARRGHDPKRLLNVIMELGSTAAVKEAVIAGYGVSILSRTSIQREIDDGLLRGVPIRGLKLVRDFYQAVHRRRNLSPVSQAFMLFARGR